MKSSKDKNKLRKIVTGLARQARKEVVDIKRHLRESYRKIVQNSYAYKQLKRETEHHRELLDKTNKDYEDSKKISIGTQGGLEKRLALVTSNYEVLASLAQKQQEQVSKLQGIIQKEEVLIEAQQARIAHLAKTTGRFSLSGALGKIKRLFRRPEDNETYLYIDRNMAIIDIEGDIGSLGYDFSLSEQDKSLADIIYEQDLAQIEAALRVLRSDEQKKGFEMGIGIKVPGKAIETTPILAHYSLELEIERDARQNILLMRTALRPEKHDYSNHPKAVYVDMCAEIKIKNEHEIITELREIAQRAAEKGIQYTLNLKGANLSQDLLIAVGQTVAASENINALGVHTLPCEQYTILRHLQLSHQRLGLRPLLYKENPKNDLLICQQHGITL